MERKNGGLRGINLGKDLWLLREDPLWIEPPCHWVMTTTLLILWESDYPVLAWQWMHRDEHHYTTAVIFPTSYIRVNYLKRFFEVKGWSKQLLQCKVTVSPNIRSSMLAMLWELSLCYLTLITSQHTLLLLLSSLLANKETGTLKIQYLAQGHTIGKPRIWI